MSKKILFVLLFTLSISFFINYSYAGCTTLSGCLNETNLVTSWNLNIGDWGFKSKIIKWVEKIAWFLGLISVSALVYAAFMMTISGWEEEKINKAKDIIKWTILWFLWIVLAGSLITIIVKFMYGLW